MFKVGDPVIFYYRSTKLRDQVGRVLAMTPQRQIVVKWPDEDYPYTLNSQDLVRVCKQCHQAHKEHGAKGKCLFGATSWA